MASYDYGKVDVCNWIRKNIPKDATILDVGACDGKWRTLLSEYGEMYACEIFEPNADIISDMYNHVFVGDIYDYRYDHFNLVIFGDVIEHMPVPRAQAVLEYAKAHSDFIIVGVPFKYPQGSLYGNQYEEHLQPDLTMELFNERYPGFEVLAQPIPGYCYFLCPPMCI